MPQTTGEVPVTRTRPLAAHRSPGGRRRVQRLGLALLVTAASLATAGPALSGTFATTAKWKDCETTKAGIRVTATFSNVAAIHGTGRYLVKKEIRWDRLVGSGRWRSSDVHTTQTSWIRIDDTAYDVVTTVGDTTVWGGSYSGGWRAHVTFKLIKNRVGPKDDRVDLIDIYPTKGSFANVGNCGPQPSTA